MSALLKRKNARVRLWRVAASCAFVVAVAIAALLFMQSPVAMSNEDDTSIDPVTLQKIRDEEARFLGGNDDAGQYDSRQSEPRQSGSWQDDPWQSDAIQDAGSTPTSSGLPEFVPNEVLVRLYGDSSAEEFKNKVAGLDYAVGSEVIEGDNGMTWATVKLAEGQDVPQAAERLVSDGIAAQAQPNYVYSLYDDDAAEADDANAAAEADGSNVASGSTLATDTSAPASGSTPATDTSAPASGSTPSTDASAPASGNVLDGAQVDPSFFGTGNSPSSTAALQSGGGLSAREAYVNDTYASLQYGLRSIEADWAYNFANGKTSGNRPVVAVFDSGAFVGHPDLEGNIVDYYDAVNGATKTQLEANGMTLRDWDFERSHGTHVAGIVSAVTNNGTGVAGSSANAGIAPVRVGERHWNEKDNAFIVGVSSRSLIRGFMYVADYNEDSRQNNGSLIKVVNLSLGFNGDERGVDSNDRLVLDWICNLAIDPYYPVLTVIAAGNDGKDGAYRDFPSYYAETAMGVIALEGSEATDYAYSARRLTSNYNMAGVFPEQIAAPGASIYSTTAYVNGDYDNPGAHYGLLSGTSQAAPFVSGAAALAWWIEPKLKPDQMKSLLMSNTEGSYSLETGMGKINTRKLVQDVASKNNEPFTPLGGTYLNGDTSLSVGKSAQLTPSRTSSWEFSSCNAEIATVDARGMVTGKKAGSTVIRAYSASLGRSAYQVVTVHGASITGASSVTKGYAITLSVSDPAVNNNGTWMWSSGNSSIASVDLFTGVVTGKKAGTTNITAKLLTNSFDVTVSKTITVVQPKSSTTTPVTTPTVTVKVGKQAMHRLYNPWSGEHFYTASMSELRNLAALGWTYEGVGWVAPTSGSNVYRLYNRWSGDHHFTTNASEKDACVKAGWTYEGVGWKSGGSKPVYREYNPYASAFYHNYTANASEHNHLCSIGWKGEGIGWYGLS